MFHFFLSIKRQILSCLLPSLIFITWYLSSLYHWLPMQILPTPYDVWDVFLYLLKEENLFSNIEISVLRVLVGIILGATSGFVFGLLFGYFKRFYQFFYLTFFGLSILPSLALLPILIIWLGLGEALKIFLIFKASFIPIAIHTYNGVKTISPQLLEVAQSFQLSKWRVIQKLIIPSILPQFFIGLRIATAAAWSTLIAVELIASSEGLGYLMTYGRQLFLLDIVFLTIILIALVGIFLDFLLSIIEKKIVNYPRSALTPASHTVTKTSYILFTILPVFLVIIWTISTHLGWVSPNLLVSPYAVLKEYFYDHYLYQSLYQTLLRTLIGLGIGTALGIFLGLLTGTNKTLNTIITPTLNTFRLITVFAWLPLITAWFGLSDFSKIVFIVMSTFFPVFITISKSIHDMPTQLKEVAQILHFSKVKTIQKLIIPQVLPDFFSGFKVALLYAWMASFGVEYLIGSGSGLGIYMIDAQQGFVISKVLAATFLIAVLGVVFNWFGNKLEKLTSGWRFNEK